MDLNEWMLLLIYSNDDDDGGEKEIPKIFSSVSKIPIAKKISKYVIGVSCVEENNHARK